MGLLLLLLLDFISREWSFDGNINSERGDDGRERERSGKRVLGRALIVCLLNGVYIRVFAEYKVLAEFS